jgi:hypothetical protein
MKSVKQEMHLLKWRMGGRERGIEELVGFSLYIFYTTSISSIRQIITHTLYPSARKVVSTNLVFYATVAYDDDDQRERDFHVPDLIHIHKFLSRC